MGHRKLLSRFSKVRQIHCNDFAVIDPMFRFVSGLHLPSFAPQNLVSGGGDATLKIWDWLNGNLVREIKVRRTIEPFIKIRPKKRRNAEPSDMDDKSDALFAIAQISSFTADNVHYLMFTAIGYV